MINARHEFETIDAFTTIAGSTAGGWAYREICLEVLEALDKIEGFSETFELWRDMAKMQDHELIEAAFADELRDYWNDNVTTMPDYCSLEWQDGELIILPCVEAMLEDTHSLDHIPDKLYSVDNVVQYTLAHYNDHGNIDYLFWNDARRAYEIVWSVV